MTRMGCTVLLIELSGTACARSLMFCLHVDTCHLQLTSLAWLHSLSVAAASIFHLKAGFVLCQKPHPDLTKRQGWHAAGKEVLDRHSQAGHCWRSGIHSVRTGICKEQGWWSYWVTWDWQHWDWQHWQQLQHRAANNRHHHKPQPEILSGCSCRQDVLQLLAGE